MFWIRFFLMFLSYNPICSTLLLVKHPSPIDRSRPVKHATSVRLSLGRSSGTRIPKPWSPAFFNVVEDFKLTPAPLLMWLHVGFERDPDRFEHDLLRSDTTLQHVAVRFKRVSSISSVWGRICPIPGLLDACFRQAFCLRRLLIFSARTPYP